MNTMQNFFGIMVLAIIVEGLISYINMIVDERKVIKWQCIIAMLLGIAVGVVYGIDLLAIFGIVSPVPYAGCVLTGILISRGSNYVADTFKVITNLNGKYKMEA